ncbi:MAG: reverse transcriptase family protein [Pseudomonas marincola]
MSEDIVAELTANNNLYQRLWKHKKMAAGPEAWRREPPRPELAEMYRPIDIPDPRLKSIQSRVCDLLGRITPPDWLFSPVKGRSYVDNAARHTGAKAFWLLDIADYFGSCTANNVAHFFHKKMECSPDVTAILVNLVCHNGSLLQGSPCSPILAYFSNLNMWLEIEARIEKTDILHSVYADDLTFSGLKIPKAFIWGIKESVHKHGLMLKAEKEVSIIDGPADITGVIVQNDKTKLPNRQMKKLFELREQRQKAKSAKLKRLLDNQISGRLAQKKQVEQAL